jgi:hypothetical protein
LRYTPFGWSKAIEFADSDLHAALHLADRAIADAGGDSALELPDTSWTFLRETLIAATYGGRLDRAADDTVLRALVEHIVSPQNMAAELPVDVLATSDVKLPPQVVTMEQCLEWAAGNAHGASHATLASLSQAAAAARGVQRGISLVTMAQELVDSGDAAWQEAASLRSDEATDWAQVARSLEPMTLDGAQHVDKLREGRRAMGAGIAREMESWVNMARAALRDLSIAASDDVMDVVASSVMCRSLMNGVPRAWDPLAPKGSLGCGVKDWCSNVVDAIRHWVVVAESFAEDQPPCIDLSFSRQPQRLISAAQYEAAASSGVDASDLTLCAASSASEAHLSVTGCRVQGVAWRDASIVATPGGDAGSCITLHLSWSSSPEGAVQLPLYLDASRCLPIASVSVQSAAGGGDGDMDTHLAALLWGAAFVGQ